MVAWQAGVSAELDFSELGQQIKGAKLRDLQRAGLGGHNLFLLAGLAPLGLFLLAVMVIPAGSEERCSLDLGMDSVLF